MKDIFREIESISGVQNIILLSGEGQVIYESTGGGRPGISGRYAYWRKLIDVLDHAREADFVFESGRLYLRQSESGYLMVTMQVSAPIAMVKLNCDIVLPLLKRPKSGKGLKGLFKR